MKISAFILVCGLCLASCNVQQSQSEKKQSIDLTTNVFTKMLTETIYLDKDTFSLSYNFDNKQIHLELSKNQRNAFVKKLTIDDFIENEVKSKSTLFIETLAFNGFDKNFNWFVFTANLKSDNPKYSDIEATFSIDLKGDFSLARQ